MTDSPEPPDGSTVTIVGGKLDGARFARADHFSPFRTTYLGPRPEVWFWYGPDVWCSWPSILRDSEGRGGCIRIEADQS